MYLLLSHCPSQFAGWGGRAVPSPAQTHGLLLFPSCFFYRNQILGIGARLVFSSVRIQRQHWRGYSELCFHTSLAKARVMQKAPRFPVVHKLICQLPCSSINQDCIWTAVYLVDLNHLSSSEFKQSVYEFLKYTKLCLRNVRKL